jgi:hypothetical protein
MVNGVLMRSEVQHILHEATDLVRSTWQHDNPYMSWRTRCWLAKSIESLARTMHEHGTFSTKRQAAIGKALESLRLNATAEEHWDGLLECLVAIQAALEPEKSMSAVKQRQASSFDLEAFLTEVAKCQRTVPAWLSSKHIPLH